MQMAQALFYPSIDIHDEAWLKTSLLYWDSLRTIVPESINEPYSTKTGRALEASGYLMPLRVHSGMYEIEELTNDTLSYLGTSEGTEMLIAEPGGRRHDIHVDKLPNIFSKFADIHPEKLPDKIRQTLEGFAARSTTGNDWLRVDESFANFYMTLLASRLAERIGATLLTSIPAADRLAVAARLDAQINGYVQFDRHSTLRNWREYEAFGRPHRMPKHLAPGMLAQLAIDKIAVAPDTPVERLIDFRERHRDELSQFRTKIEQLAASVETDQPIEALRQRVDDLYAKEVAPAITNLKKALDGRRIRWVGEGLLKLAFLSAGSSTMLVATGLAVPTALLAGAGLSLIVSGTMYNVDKEESLRTNPYAYLLSVERELV
jgi:hypothetical protein